MEEVSDMLPYYVYNPYYFYDPYRYAYLLRGGSPFFYGYPACISCGYYNGMVGRNSILHQSTFRERINGVRVCPDPQQPEQQAFTMEELAKYDGTGGNPAYVAVHGIVYDVSNEKTWGGSTHFGLFAGQDLTRQFQSCHGRIGILNGLPKVGILKNSMEGN